MAQLMRRAEAGLVRCKDLPTKHVTITEACSYRQQQQQEHTGQRQQPQQLDQKQQLLQAVHSSRRHLLFLAAAIPTLSAQLSAQAASKQTYSPAFLKAFQQALSTTGSFEVGDVAEPSGAAPGACCINLNCAGTRHV